MTDGDTGLGCEVQRTVVQFSLCAPVVPQGCSPVRGGAVLGRGVAGEGACAELSEAASLAGMAARTAVSAWSSDRVTCFFRNSSLLGPEDREG